MDMRDIKEFVKDASKYLLVIIIVLVLFVYVVSLQQVIGPSMNPNYEEGQIYILNKIKYKIFDIKRFDVVVLNSKKSKYMIKRVIGLPGEHVKYEDNKLYINGNIVEEDFEKNSDTVDYDINVLGSHYIPEGYYFVLGDNRGNSEDSRHYGLVKEEDIIGEVNIKIWPLIE